MILLLAACNLPPSALDFHIEPNGPMTGDDLVATITVEAVDPDGDAIEYVYAWYRDGSKVPSLTTDTVPASETSKGEEWVCEIYATDGKDDGPTAEDDVEIWNTGPEVDEIVLDPEAPLSEESVLAEVLTSDADGDELTVTGSWAEGSRTVEGFELDASETQRGEVWTFTAKVSDGAASHTDSVDLHIENSPPVLEVELGPEGATVLDELVVTLEASDEDGDELSYTYVWSIDGAELATTGESLPAGTATRDQEVQVRVTPHDGFTDGEEASSELLTIANSAPTFSAASLSHEEPREGDTVSCSGLGYEDADGDEMQDERARWLVNGVEVSTGGSITGALYDEGDTLQCAIAPRDHVDYGEEVWTSEVSVVNTAPDVSGVTVSLDEASPQEADTVTYTVSGSATDVDGDSVSVSATWYVEGSAVSTDSSIDGSLFDKNEELYVVLTYADEADSSTVKSDVGTAVNTLPVIDSVSVDSPLYTDSLATATISASDADGDTVSYDFVWKVEGSNVGVDSTLNGATHFDKDEQVKVRVTPKDDEGSGSAKSSSAVTVLNTPPEAPGVAISPAEPGAGEELVCVVTDSVDADGDTVTYSIEWDADGSAFTDTDTTTRTDDTVPADETAEDEVWTCTVTPDDGEDEGDEGSDSVTLSDDCWAEVYSDNLHGAPSGSTVLYGGWGSTYASSVDSVGCLMQTSDWNYTYIPVTRSALDFERIEVDVYFPGTSSTSYNMYAFGDRYGLNYVENGLWFAESTSAANISQGNTFSSSSTVASWSSPVTSSGSWVSLAWVIDYSSNSMDFYVDGTLEASGGVTAANLGGADVVLRSGGVAYSIAPNVCWANLAVYEADSDSDCYE